MGDPAGAAAHIHKSLKKDGTWMIVEPMAGDRLEQNLNPVGRLHVRGPLRVTSRHVDALVGTVKVTL